MKFLEAVKKAKNGTHNSIKELLDYVESFHRPTNWVPADDPKHFMMGYHDLENDVYATVSLIKQNPCMDPETRARVRSFDTGKSYVDWLNDRNNQY